MNDLSKLNNTYINFILCFFVMLLLSACENNGSAAKTTSINLNITDTSGVPVESVSITVLKADSSNKVSAEVVSTGNGKYEVSDIPEQTDLVLQLYKSGYSSQIKPLTTLSAGTITTAYQTVMIKQQEPISFSVDTDAQINGKHGARVEVSASAFVDQNGNLVSGDIELHMTPVDVSTAAGIQAFPGSFSGILDDGSLTPVIVSFGTTEYNFSQNGEALQLAPGQSAEIDMPMYIATYPNGNAIKPGDEIPLWYLNETTGIWQQEGVGEVVVNPASPIGLSMRATVSHFSWWNTDWFPERDEYYTISMEMVLVDENDEIVSGFDGESSLLQVRAPGYSTQVHVTIGEFVEQVVFDGAWCFDAETTLDFGDGPELVVAPEVCIQVPGTESVSLRLNATDRGLIVSDLVRETATINSDFGACGDLPRIDAKSLHTPITFSIVSGSLPPGLLLLDNGSIVGSPTTDFTRSYQADIRVEDTAGNSEMVIVNIQVASELTAREFGIQPILEIGTSYVVQTPVSASGGLEAYKWSLEGATEGSILTSGIDFDSSTGSFSVTPGRIFVGNEIAPYYAYDLDITIKDQNCASVTTEYLQYVIYVPILSGQPANVASAQPFSFTPTNTGLPATEWGIEASADLLGWTTFDPSTGELSGTPAIEDVGLYENITFIAYGPASTDPVISSQGISRIEKRLTVSFEVTLASPNVAPINNITLATNQSLNFTPTNLGGTASSWEIDNAPIWLTFDTTNGNISGTPTVVATHNDIIIRAINVNGSPETQPFIIDVIPQLTAPQLSGTPSVGNVGINYFFTPVNNGGLATSYAINNIALLPPGLNFSTASGAISGKPTTVGSFTGIEVTASNAAGSSPLMLIIDIDKGQVILTFVDPGPVLKDFGEASFKNNVLTSVTINSFSYQSSDTAVASVSSSGEVTILQVGETIIRVDRAADANYNASNASYILRVSPGVPTLVTLPPGTNLTDFYQYTPIVFGNTIVSWVLISGALPDGLTLNGSSGLISGTATALRDFGFTLQGVNSQGDNLNFSLSIEVGTDPVLINQANTDFCTNWFGLEGGCGLTLTTSSIVNYTFVSDAGAVDGWSVTGALPGGLTLNSSSGLLSGIPTETGSFSVTINAFNDFGSDTFVMQISVK